MKKVLLLVGVVFGAVMAQASSYNWAVMYSDSSVSSWGNATAMIFAGGNAGENVTNVMKIIGANTGSALKTALESATLRNSETSGASSVVFDVNKEDNTIVTTRMMTSELATGDDTAFVMIFTDDNFNADTQVYWTNAGTTESLGVRITNEAFVNSKTIGEIQKEYPSVPEPGVMALLALGVAGLALRRKTA